MSLTNAQLQAQKVALDLFENLGIFFWMGFFSGWDLQVTADK